MTLARLAEPRAICAAAGYHVTTGQRLMRFATASASSAVPYITSKTHRAVPSSWIASSINETLEIVGEIRAAIWFVRVHLITHHSLSPYFPRPISPLASGSQASPSVNVNSLMV